MGSRGYQDPDDWKTEEEKARDLSEVQNREIQSSLWWDLFLVVVALLCVVFIGYLIFR